jgi:hypothetical protein
MKRTTLSILMALSACGGPSPSDTGRIPESAPSRVFDPDGDGTANGTQFDTDGDGNFDAVDTDGDGLLDGGDFDGDGVVTLFDQQGTGLELLTPDEIDKFPEDLDPDFEGELEDKGDAPSQPVATRASVDLRAQFPRPVNQGKLGSCAAFATSSVATYIRAQREGADPNTVWGSPQFLYAKMLEARSGKCNDGTSILAGVAQLIFYGMTPHAKLPYSDTMCAMNPTLEEGDGYRVGSFSLLKPYSRDKLKEHLSAGHAIVFGSTLPPNFGKWAGAQAKTGVFKSDDGQLGGQHGGGHAMVILGYDDQKSAYLVLNSWGTDWGDGGYMWWDYEDLEKRDPQMITVNAYRQLPPAPTISVEEPSLTITTGKALIARGQSGDRLVIGAIANAPLTIGEIILDDQAPISGLVLFAHGYLTAKSTGPLAAGSHTLTVRGLIPRGIGQADMFMGQSFERKLTVQVGEPITDPDNAL